LPKNAVDNDIAIEVKPLHYNYNPVALLYHHPIIQP